MSAYINAAAKAEFPWLSYCDDPSVQSTVPRTSFISAVLYLDGWSSKTSIDRPICQVSVLIMASMTVSPSDEEVSAGLIVAPTPQATAATRSFCVCLRVNVVITYQLEAQHTTTYSGSPSES